MNPARLPRTLLGFGIACVLPAVCAACATHNIPNTDIPDTSHNRALVDAAERYRHAVERRDTRELLSLAAPDYFEDGGTPTGDDDYGFEGLRRLLGAWADEVRDVRYEMRYRHITFEHEGERALVDYTYTGSFTLRQPALPLPAGVMPPAESMLNTDPARAPRVQGSDGEQWYRRVADNRLEFERRNGEWRIVAGM